MTRRYVRFCDFVCFFVLCLVFTFSSLFLWLGQSIEFFDAVGLDYVSCSPFRVPVARLATAQAAIRRKAKGGSCDVTRP